ncbi:hypothetical protein Pmar_PMAR022992 [Perkinsus marinus ATCC 50983]|uniref:Uncharacterized protein n=1 Tax=Perkinsus marinus (strain ATCC 50983 / TXsc) TaxID=423536 RepID=C5LHU1_PERM5|nr:hypothetical protein Pmar_PMAR022992 [Perkinsus marinus ATCC 50983]EER03695.1 hypothetical protein Pmar_PMAR022992 [Perkinsus marinus ATCC 50983]|eukprot:XP_002771879.1 hypothetical protein Pmar_PMAR022992 [Perkinsus marinus ATCC 50983]
MAFFEASRLPLYSNIYSCTTLVGNWHEERHEPQQRARYGEGFFSESSLLLPNPNSRTYVTTSKHSAEEGLGVDKKQHSLNKEDLQALLSSEPASDLLGGACRYDSDISTTSRDAYGDPRAITDPAKGDHVPSEELEEYRRRWTRGMDGEEETGPFRKE